MFSWPLATNVVPQHTSALPSTRNNQDFAKTGNSCGCVPLRTLNIQDRRSQRFRSPSGNSSVSGLQLRYSFRSRNRWWRVRKEVNIYGVARTGVLPAVSASHGKTMSQGLCCGALAGTPGPYPCEAKAGFLTPGGNSADEADALMQHALEDCAAGPRFLIEVANCGVHSLVAYVGHRDRQCCSLPCLEDVGIFWQTSGWLAAMGHFAAQPLL